MMHLMDISNEIQESLGTSYNIVPDYIDEEELLRILDLLSEGVYNIHIFLLCNLEIFAFFTSDISVHTPKR